MKTNLKTSIPTALLALALLTAGCATADLPQDTDTAPATEADAVIVKVITADYSISVPADAGDAVKSAAEELSAAILDATGVTVPVTEEDAENAIRLSVAPSDTVGEYGYSITAVDGDVCINAANEDSLMYALALFERDFIKAGGGDLIVPASTDITSKRDEKLILADYIDLGLDIEAEISPRASFGVYKANGFNYSIAQGAATDGEYFYAALLRDDFEGVVVKMDYNGQFVAATKPQEFGHANDMTFDTDKNLLVVLHGTSSVNLERGNGNGRRFSLIDPETMEVIYTNYEAFPLGKEAGAISYNTETGVYTIGRLCTYFHQFKMNDDYTLDYSLSTLRGSAEEEGRVGYVGQGLGGDNRYVYFPYSHGKTDNLLVVYNDEGKYVTTISYPCTIESESVMFANGKYYIHYNSGGSQIYELVYKPVYRADVSEAE